MEEVICIKIHNKSTYNYVKGKNISVNKNDKIVIMIDSTSYLATVIFKENCPKNDVFYENIEILRKATATDLTTQRTLDNLSNKIIDSVLNIVKTLELNMKVISANFSLDRTKLSINYYSENRIDFRELLRELAYIFRTRIELYQVTDREYSRELGGLGPCGKPLCCSIFLNDFHQVSIKMVKEQNLMFNMSKITGACGKLLCCLKYESDYYSKLAEKLPEVGSPIVINDKEYIFKDIDPIKEIILVQHKNEQLIMDLGELIKE